jgi:hypothetical protein
MIGFQIEESMRLLYKQKEGIIGKEGREMEEINYGTCTFRDSLLFAVI